ncbi:MAG TPA: PepSY domain-containing protein [Gemmatimonadaceae bacterium]|nr:PepSY domain-containing protein [Gemmatimonadaceae bacterium]
MTPSSGASSTGSTGASASAATGLVQPTSGVVKVEIKVAPSLASTVKISADSAFALARASNTAGEISSAELEMTNKRLVYQVKMVKGAGASTVYVDAMTGEVVKDKKFGGLKAAVENQEEAQKLYNAKKDSAATKKP